MKHIFAVHSPITYLVAISVAESMKLPSSDVLLLCDGFTDKKAPYTAVDVNAYYKRSNPLSRALALIKYFDQASLLDRIISDFTREDKFMAYVPVLRFHEKVLITHQQCAGFNFIEEGLAHYYKNESINSLSVANSFQPWRSPLGKSNNWKRIFLELVNLLRGYNFRLQTLPFSYSCYNNFADVYFWGVTNAVFPMAPPERKRVIHFVQPGERNEGLDLSNSVVWIGDNGVDYYGYSKEVYLDGIRNGFIRYLKERGIDRAYVKFHRGESRRMQDEQMELFKSCGITVDVIPGDVIMELCLMKAQHVTLFGVCSSLLYYAATMGHHAISIYGLVEREYHRALAGKDMDFYWELVQQLKSETYNRI
jgi:hypothetical protein